MRSKLVLMTCAAIFALGASAQANDLVFSSWGGTTQDAQKAAWAEKFMVATGMGSRGLSFTALCGELLAARLHAEPLPLEQRLADALAPQTSG